MSCPKVLLRNALARYVRSFAPLGMTLQLNLRASAPSANAPCNILRRRGRRENPDLGQSAPSHHTPHTDAGHHRRCVNALRISFAAWKLHGDVMPDERFRDQKK